MPYDFTCIQCLSTWTQKSLTLDAETPCMHCGGTTFEVREVTERGDSGTDLSQRSTPEDTQQ